jgi:tetratricopeptide (TPR) repeat protein
MPHISAVLIVKNEADRIGACLEALQPVADEIVVADTGSSDATLAVARAYTPHCHEIPWEEDFAAARNRAIALATGSWILSIDADEVIESPERARSLLEEFIQFQPAGTTGTIQHQSPTGAGSEQRLVRGDVERFFPRDGYRFAGIIHEQLVPVSGIHGGRASTGVVVRHAGYDFAATDPAHKGQRNLPLLQRAVAADPKNEYYHYQLGKTYYALKHYGEAASAFERALGLISFTGNAPTGHDGQPVGREILTTLVTSLAYAYANTNRLGDAEALLSAHINLGHAGTRWADFYHVCGYIALMLGDVERARAGYLESMRCGQVREDVAGTGSFASAYHLGLLAEAEQDLIGAIGHYADSLSYKADYSVTLDRLIDFMVEHQFGVAPSIQSHADPAAFHAICLRKLSAYLEAGKKDKADFIITTVGLLAITNRIFAGDLLARCQERRKPYGI